MAVTSLVVAAVAGAQDPAELDLDFGVGGVARFDLGFDAEICDAQVATDGVTVLALATGAGSEIWRVDAGGERVELVKSFPFAESSAGCVYGVRSLACAEEGTACYGAGRRSLDGEDLTWLISFDRFTGQAVDPIPGGNALYDLAAGGEEGANGVVLAPAAEASSTAGISTASSERVTESSSAGAGGGPSVVAVGGAGGLGLVVTQDSPMSGFVGNTVQISGEETVIERAVIEGGNELWVQGMSEGYFFLCKYLRQPQGGGWVPVSNFGKQGCVKVQRSADRFRSLGFKVYAGLVYVLNDVRSEEGEERRLEWSVFDANFGDKRQTVPAAPPERVDWDVSPTVACSPDAPPRAQYRREVDGSMVVSSAGRALSGVFVEEAVEEAFIPFIPADDLAAQFLLLLEGDDRSRARPAPIAASAAIRRPSALRGTNLPTEDTYVSIGRAVTSPDADLVLVRFFAPSSECEPSETAACLLGGRFRVEGTMKDFSDPPNELPTRVMTFAGGRAESDQAVFFESFSPGNFEAGVKMVDACGLPATNPLRAYWAFFGGLTNAETRITVLDTVTEDRYEWFNPSGVFPQTVGDTAAFPCVDGEPSVGCSRDDETACLLGERFRVSGTMKDFADPPNEVPTRVMDFPGDGRAESDQAVFFESFSPGNFEAGVKMVDACELPEGNPLRAHWAFYGALTNAETTLRITRVATGEVDEWFNPAGAFPVSVGRLDAFACEELP